MTARVVPKGFGPGLNRHDSAVLDRPFKLQDLTGLVVHCLTTGQPMDPAELYRELAAAIDRDRGPAWQPRAHRAERFARHVAGLAELATV